VRVIIQECLKDIRWLKSAFKGIVDMSTIDFSTASSKLLDKFLLILVIFVLFVLTSCDGEATAEPTLPATDAPAPASTDTPLPATTEEPASVSDADWQQEFNIDERQLSDTGESEYFILMPGFQLELASDTEHLIITVMDETKEINGITTRVVEEHEERNGALYEVSRNFYAMDPETGDVFYFGEEVDFYENGEISGHAGAWLAYERENQPGLIMSGNPEVGMMYYQEVAPGAAMDRAEVLSVSETFETPAGTFEDALVTEESSPLEPTIIERKTYAPGIGLVQDQRLLLVRYGYVEE
jgi:hypothetical protein